MFLKFKKILIGFFVLLSASNYAQIGSGKITIEIFAPPGEYDSISYYFSKNSIMAYGLWGYEHVLFDTFGHSKLELFTNEINSLLILFNPVNEGTESMLKNRVSLIVRPGESYKVEYNPDNPLWFDISGNLGELQQLYTKYQYDHCTWENRSDTVPERILSNLNDSISCFISLY